MRLLIFSSYFPPHVGGLEGYVRDLNEELISLGLTEAITVLTPRIPSEGLPFEEVAPGYRVVRYPALDLIANFPCPAPWRRGFTRAMRAALRRRKYDVVICHTRFFLSSLAALAYSRVAGLPLIHVEHGSDYVHLDSRMNSMAARLYDLTLGRLVLRHAQAVVAISQAAARFVTDLAGREATVIYRGMDHARYEAVQPCPELAAWSAGRPVAMFVGRLIDGKGVADLIEAFAQLAHEQAMLCVVGDGPRRPELEALCDARGLRERCLFTGYQPEDRALALIRGADVIVNPSYTEGLPTSVLEAALLGRGIVASDVGGTSEVVVNGRSALLVAAGDTMALREALDALLDDPALRVRMGQTARAEAMERFERSTSARSFIALARQLVEVDASGGSLR
jgi:glycosyltransferase involved in cell wall biosynthesis